MLAGIGFTVSIFISSLAFDSDLYVAEAKTAVLAASLIAGLLGYFALWERDPVPADAEQRSMQIAGRRRSKERSNGAKTRYNFEVSSIARKGLSIAHSSCMNFLVCR